MVRPQPPSVLSGLSARTGTDQLGGDGAYAGTLSHTVGKSRVATYHPRITPESFNHTSYIKNLNLKGSFASRAITVPNKVVRRFPLSDI